MTLRSWSRKPMLTLRDAWDLLFRRKLFMISVLAASLLVAALFPYVKALVVMTMFVMLGAASMLYNRWLKVSLGIELNMLGIVVTGMLYGSLVGMAVGMAALFIAMLFNEHLTHAYVVSFAAIAIVALLVPVVAGLGITTAGILLTLLFDLLIVPGYLHMGSSPGRIALFVATHLPFNIWVFMVLAPRMLSFFQ